MSSTTARSQYHEPQSTKPHVSPWVPVTLLVITSAALAVPLVKLRQQQKAAASSGALVKKLHTASAPPPRRSAMRIPSAAGPSRATVSSSPRFSAPPPRRVVRPSAVPIASVSPALNTSSTSPTKADVSSSAASTSKDVADDSFNAPLYTLKAFSIATGLVMAGGAVMVWGVKTYLGVRDTKEFAALMRYKLLTSMPFLTSRIHRPPSSDPLPPTFPFTSPSLSDVSLPSSAVAPEERSISLAGGLQTETGLWSWSAAQARLSKAYDTGGIVGWMEAAALEMEMEADIERRKRGVWADTTQTAVGGDAASS